MKPFHAVLFTVGLFAGMLVALEIGHRVGVRRAGAEGARPGLAAVEGAVFALLGLLIAFTFSGAVTRFDARRQLIVEEANTIGTAYRRLELLPPEAQGPLRELFRQYLDSRLATYRKLPDLAAAQAELAQSARLQDAIWTNVVATCRSVPSPPPTMLLLPAVNQMIDITTKRTMAARMHPPATIFAMLAALAVTGAFLAGCAMAAGRARSWIHVIGFPTIIAVTAYVILDIEFPRFGLIRVDAFDEVLTELRQTMK